MLNPYDISLKHVQRVDFTKSQTAYIVTLGKLIIPKSKKVKDVCYDVELTPIDDFGDRFNINQGDTVKIQLQKVLPRQILTVKQLTDLVIRGIQKVVKKKKIFSFRLEQWEDLCGDWLLLIGSK